ncbi:unnamed protein product [Candidula unifasciata]|uniref:EamA domain-containing protein n=1 Tax=Candidula unifasciata TaxID=100452 RepID=A0A8S4A937_9EUPU|nr:unnamed protein product [Candidula unifasciata]
MNHEDPPENKQHWDWSSRHSRILIGSLISLATAVAWVSFSELIQDALANENFNAPFTLAYVFTAFLIVLFPAFLCFARISKLRPIKDILRECLQLYQDNEEFSRLQFLWKSSAFFLVSIFTMYIYIRALQRLGAADCTALFAANHSFVYLLSWIILFEKFIPMRIFAMIFSITGIVLFAYVDGFGTPAMFGVVLGVTSSAGAAVYMVLYKKFVGEASSAQASFFLSIIGLFALLFLWPLWLLLYLLRVEVIVWGHVPWGIIIPSAILIIVYSAAKECTVQLTYPMCIGMGLVLAIPLSAAADTIWKGREFSGMKIAALVLITTGVFLILLPENWHHHICKHIRAKPRDSEQQSIGHSTTLRSRLSRTSYM